MKHLVHRRVLFAAAAVASVACIILSSHHGQFGAMIIKGREKFCLSSQHSTVVKSNDTNDSISQISPHRLAVIVPYRNRPEQLKSFVPHIHDFLTRQFVKHKIYIINQVDRYRFNRASLINAGYEISSGECDYMVMHDVDILPLHPALNYSYPEPGTIRHLSPPSIHPRYHYKTYVGGVLLLKNSDFKQMNGMSNDFWGWGKEDDDFYKKIKSTKLKIESAAGKGLTRMNGLKHLHTNETRDRTTYVKLKKPVGRTVGLSSLQFEIVNSRKLAYDSASAVIYDVKLTCDLNKTPWCLTPAQLTVEKQKLNLTQLTDS